jgi:copper chaperone CopZ
MKRSSHYLHVTGGRLRIKIPQVKNSRKAALKIELFLRSINGITSVKANPLTGNVLVLFDSDDIKHEDVVETIKKHGYLEEPKVQPRSPGVSHTNRVFRPDYASNIVAEIVLQKAVELTLRRALLALL